MNTAAQEKEQSTEEMDAVLEKQREYYNRISDTYDSHYANPYALKYRYGIYADILKGIDFSGLSVLDAMCGGGESANFFAQRGAKLTGLDLSENQCEIFKKKFPGSEVHCKSITDTGLPDNSFDFIVTDSIHHVQPSIDPALNEIKRILKPGGQLLLWEPSAGSILDIARKAWYKLDPTYFEENEESVDVEKVLQAHGDTLELVKQEYGGNIAYLLVQCSMAFRIPPKVVSFIAPVLLPIDRLIQRIQGRLFSCWVLALFKKRG